MDLGAILLLLGLTVLVGIYVGKPFFRSSTPATPRDKKNRAQKDHQVSALLAEQDHLLTALQELDFDQALGKIPEEEYGYQRAELVQRGILVLKQLDEIQQVSVSGQTQDRLEAEIARRRSAKQSSASQGEVRTTGADSTLADPSGQLVSPKEDDNLEDMIAARRRSRPEKAAGFCPRCGHPAQKSDRFCSKCGTTLS